jgi:hypothetical protein
MYLQPIKTRMCQMCEALFYCAKKSSAKYCPQCRPYVKRKSGTGANSYPVKCKICGRKFNRTGSKRTKYCSDGCRHTGRKQIILKCVNKRRKFGIEKEPLGTRAYVGSKISRVNGQERVLSALLLEKECKKYRG